MWTTVNCVSSFPVDMVWALLILVAWSRVAPLISTQRNWKPKYVLRFNLQSFLTIGKLDCYKAIETISVRDFYVGLFFLVFLSHFASKLQSWTKVLTHLSKTNAFYRRPSVTWKSTFFVDSQPPLSPFSMLQYAPWTLGYNIEKGRGGRNVKIRHWKLTR